ncbi:MAG: hypothetical protein WC254_06080 [Candidatus Woesearchaeota archaeon]|jgi:hypothetical protein
MKLNETKYSLYIVAIVGVVAAIALLILILSSVGTATISGAAVQSTTTTYTQWTTCLETGDSVKLGNHQGSTLTKYNVCTGDNDKMLSYVSCAQDVDGYYTYKYSNPVQCPNMESCKIWIDNTAYCG